MTGRPTVAVVTACSVVAAATIVTGVRVAQHSVLDHHDAVRITVDLPEAKARPSQLLVGLRMTAVDGGEATPELRRESTALVTALSAEGHIVGQSVVPRSWVLRPAEEQVTFESTAAALVLQSPTLVTSAPVLARTVLDRARNSPAVSRLADLLRAEAKQRPDYLTAVSPTVARATAAAGRQVSDGLERQGPPPPAASTPAATADDTAEGSTTDLLTLYDHDRASACVSQRRADGLCIQHTPVGDSEPTVELSQWTGVWQTLFPQGRDGGAASVLPIAIVPPARYAPPAFGGFISEGLAKVESRSLCQRFRSVLVKDCDNDNVLDVLLEQVTWSGTSTAVALPLTREVADTPTVAIGCTSDESTHAAHDLHVAMGCALTVFSQGLLPIVELVLDVRAPRDAAQVAPELAKRERIEDTKRLSRAARDRYAAKRTVEDRRRQQEELRGTGDQAGLAKARRQRYDAEQALRRSKAAEDAEYAKYTGFGRADANERELRSTQALIAFGVAAAPAVNDLLVNLRAGRWGDAAKAMGQLSATVFLNLDVLVKWFLPNYVDWFLSAARAQVIRLIPAFAPPMAPVMLTMAYVDLFEHAFGTTQSYYNAIQQIRSGRPTLRFAPISSNRLRGSTRVSTVQLTGTDLSSARAGVRSLRSFASVPVVAANTVLVPSQLLQNRSFIVTHANVEDLTFNVGLGARENDVTVEGLYLTLLTARTPLGVGPATVGPAPEACKGDVQRCDLVTVHAEGTWSDAKSFTGVVTRRIPERGSPVLAYFVSPTDGTMLSEERRPVGGYVMATHAPGDAHELAGIAAQEVDGELVVMAEGLVSRVTEELATTREDGQ